MRYKVVVLYGYKASAIGQENLTKMFQADGRFYTKRHSMASSRRPMQGALKWQSAGKNQSKSVTRTLFSPPFSRHVEYSNGQLFSRVSP